MLEEPRALCTPFAFYLSIVMDRCARKYPDKILVFEIFEKICWRKCEGMDDFHRKRFVQMSEHDEKRFEKEMKAYIAEQKKERKRKKKEKKALKKTEKKNHSENDGKWNEPQEDEFVNGNKAREETHPDVEDDTNESEGDFTSFPGSSTKKFGGK